MFCCGANDVLMLVFFFVFTCLLFSPPLSAVLQVIVGKCIPSAVTEDIVCASTCSHVGRQKTGSIDLL